MKADDYVKIAREFLEKPPLLSVLWDGVPPSKDGPCQPEDAVLDTLRRLANEVKVIGDTRKAKTDEAILGIMLELRQKWHAICDRMQHPLFTKPAFELFFKTIGEDVQRRKRQ